MSLYGAMFSGVSGLNSQSQALGMISDNISNVNTVGYKTTKASFSTLVTSQTVNSYSPGGVRSSPNYLIDRQGLIQNSENETDLAITGPGFFVVTATSTPGASDTRSYTRAGQFTTDADGYLVTPAGFYLQGWPTDALGTPTPANTSVLTSLESVRVGAVSGQANATSLIEVGVNLPATAALAATETTNVQIFDSLGVAHNVTLTWTKTATNQWTVTAAAPDAGSVEEGTVGSGTAFSVVVNFNADGTPATFDGAATPPDLALGTWTSGAANSIITMDFGTQNTTDGTTQFSDSYSVGYVNQNGVQFGNFIGVSVDETGLVTALYDNGETVPVYLLPIATFANPNGLNAETGSIFNQSARSGDYVLRTAGSARAGTVVPSAVEASTTDLANEFTNMIITQRAYSASAKIITTADDMLDDLIRIKR